MHSAAHLLLLTGCVREAPEELDDLLHWFWEGHTDLSDREIARGVDNLEPLLGDGERLEGELSDLTEEGIDGIELEETVDLEKTRGLYTAGTLDCSLRRVHEVLLDDDQTSLYDHFYTGLERDYDADKSDYVRGDAGQLWWDETYTAEILGSPFTGHRRAGLRQVEADRGLVVIRVFWLTRPVDFDEEGAKSVDQEYLVDVHFEKDSKTRHAVATWRALEIGGGLSIHDEAVMMGSLNDLEKWDDRTVEACEKR